MEGKVDIIFGLRIHGGRAGRECRASSPTFLSPCSTHEILQSILVLKYVIPGYSEQFTYYGYANLSQNVTLMLSAIVLWIAQSGSSEYEYNLTL